MLGVETLGIVGTTAGTVVLVVASIPLRVEVPTIVLLRGVQQVAILTTPLILSTPITIQTVEVLIAVREDQVA